MKFKHSILIVIISILFIGTNLFATPNSKWTLQACVQYAIDHNIQIKQSELNLTKSGTFKISNFLKITPV